jgi:hypothetical protein
MAAEDADGDDLVPDEFFAPKIFLLMLKTAGCDARASSSSSSSPRPRRILKSSSSSSSSSSSRPPRPLTSAPLLTQEAADAREERRGDV